MKTEGDHRLAVIDATDGILGRIASHAAKQALLGKKVIIVNCADAMISGRRQNILKEYRIARQRGGASLKGPNFPKESFRIMKRTVRGMLNYSHGKGKEAFKRVMCYNDCPAEFASMKKTIEIREIKSKGIRLGEVSKLL